MADQSSTETFSVTTVRVDAPVYQMTIGWGDMGRTWRVELPGSMTPEQVDRVEQTIRRVVGAAVEEERRETTARIGAEVETLKAKLDDATNAGGQLLAELKCASDEVDYKTKIALDATRQRDEETAKLAEAHADVERLTAVCVESAREIKALKETETALRADVADRDRCNASLAQQRRDLRAEVDRLRADTDKLRDDADDARMLRAERDDHAKAGWASRRRIEELSAELASVRADVERLTAERDEARATIDQAARELHCALDMTPGAKVVLMPLHAYVGEVFKRVDALKASKTTVDVEAIEGLATEAFWRCDSYGPTPSIKAAVRAVLAHLGLTPSTPKTATDLVPLSHVTSILETFAARLDGHAQSVRDDHDRADECAQADDIDRFDAGAKAVREAAELVRNALAKPAGEEPSDQHHAAAASQAADAPSSPHPTLGKLERPPIVHTGWMTLEMRS